MANADTLDGAGVNSGNALDGAKVQQNSETTKDKNKNNKAHSYEVTKIELLDGLSNSPRLEMVESNPSISVAKVQQNSEITKLSSKKEPPPFCYTTPH